MVIDWTISVGNMLTLAGVLCTIVGAFFAVRHEVSKLQWDESSISNRLGNIETEMRTLSQVVTKMAVQDQRLTDHARRIGVIEEDVRRLDRHVGAV